MELDTLLFFIIGALLGGSIVFILSRFAIKKATFSAEMLKEKLATYKETQEWIQLQFKGISADALKQSQETFLQLAKTSLEAVQERSPNAFEKKEKAVIDFIKPVKESLDKVDQKIHELEKARIGAFSSLKEQIQALIEMQKALKAETVHLSQALKKPATRGRWGEIQLKRVVELAGMVAHCDFYEQKSVTTEEGRWRPDLLVRLPGGKQIVVDAKVPLEAYLESIESDNEERKNLKLKDHARQVRSHIVQLSRKSYWEQFKPTPEFVILFLPGETFFSAALEEDPTLLEAGVDQNVILATPMTLIALLRAVAYGWRQENLSRSADQISSLGKELYKRLSDLSCHFGKVGKRLEQSVEAYNKAVGSLESRVLVSARRFKDLEVMEGEREIEILEPLGQKTRLLTAAELNPSSPEND